jgi:starch synthase (maltosyl-transferring)
MPVVKNRARVVIENVTPEIDGGRFAIKRVVGESVHVEADAFADGHDEISVALLHRKESAKEWVSTPMKALGNDRWAGEFSVKEIGTHRYCVRGWVDHFKTWRRDLVKRLNAGQDVSVDLLIGANLIERAAARASKGDAELLRATVSYMRGAEAMSKRAGFALDEELQRLVSLYSDLDNACMYDRELPLWVDRERSRYSTW